MWFQSILPDSSISDEECIEEEGKGSMSGFEHGMHIITKCMS
jgi:hypothetical protein